MYSISCVVSICRGSEYTVVSLKIFSVERVFSVGIQYKGGHAVLCYLHVKGMQIGNISQEMVDISSVESRCLSGTETG
jgi:hypothetical protein